MLDKVTQVINLETVTNVIEAAKTKYKEEVKTEKVKTMFNSAYSKVS